MVRLDESKVTSQGQVSIPKKIRLKLHLNPGDRVVFWEDENGQIILRESDFPIQFTQADWAAFLAKTEKEPTTRVKGAKAFLKHLDDLSRKKK